MTWLPPAWADARVAVVHEPERQHPGVESVGDPRGNDFQRAIEVAPEDAERAMGARAYIDGAVGPVTTDNGAHLAGLQRRTQLGEKSRFEFRIGGLVLRMGHREHRCGRSD